MNLQTESFPMETKVKFSMEIIGNLSIESFFMEIESEYAYRNKIKSPYVEFSYEKRANHSIEKRENLSI